MDILTIYYRNWTLISSFTTIYLYILNWNKVQIRKYVPKEEGNIYNVFRVIIMAQSASNAQFFVDDTSGWTIYSSPFIWDLYILADVGRYWLHPLNKKAKVLKIQWGMFLENIIFILQFFSSYYFFTHKPVILLKMVIWKRYFIM